MPIEIGKHVNSIQQGDNNDVWTTGYTQENEYIWSLTSCKINAEWINNLNIRNHTIKLLEENMR